MPSPSPSTNDGSTNQLPSITESTTPTEPQSAGSIQAAESPATMKDDSGKEQSPAPVTVATTNGTAEAEAQDLIETRVNGKVEAEGQNTVVPDVEQVAAVAEEEEGAEEKPSRPSKKLCEVCNVAEGRYKCTICYTPYCSIICSREHKLTHPALGSPPRPPVLLATIPPPTTHPLPKKPITNPFEALDHAPELHVLFKRYPNLPACLLKIHESTLQSHNSSNTREQSRNRKGGRNSSKNGNRQEPKWTAERGIKKGMAALERARNTGGDDGEGVREYIKIVLGLLERQRMADGGVNGMGETADDVLKREAAENDVKIIRELLERDVGSLR